MQFGRAGRIFNTHEALAPKAPFLIVYQLLDKNQLGIARIIHTARNWPPGDWPAED
jgi:toxin ParE1/3/4